VGQFFEPLYIGRAQIKIYYTQPTYDPFMGTLGKEHGKPYA